MLNIIAAVLVFGLIVLVHEFGHFLLAKLNGIGVVEFSIGMGPRLLSWQGKETRYSIKILPFGGSWGRTRRTRIPAPSTTSPSGPGSLWSSPARPSTLSWPSSSPSSSC